MNSDIKRLSRKSKATRKVNIGSTVIGGDKVVVIAGPCTIESEKQVNSIADFVKENGATALRGGAWKPRTSPYSFRGLGEEGVDYLIKAGLDAGLPIVTEVTRPELVNKLEGRIDCFQVGAKNMQNFDLLEELGKIDKPVLLKKSQYATYEEFLLAAEYIANAGNENIILCERGTRTAENLIRSTFDVSAIPVLKSMTDLPVIADPSHAAGRSDIVKDLSKAAIAAGADGLLIEVHETPEEALCDGEQSIDFNEFKGLIDESRIIAEAVGRSL